MKKTVTIIVALIICTIAIMGQGVAINTDGYSADASALQDIKSADIGSHDLYNINTIDSMNPAFGCYALNQNHAGSNNTTIGYYAGLFDEFINIDITSPVRYLTGHNSTNSICFANTSITEIVGREKKSL